MADWIMTTTDAEIEAAIEAAQTEPEGTRIVNIEYHSESNLDLFVFTLSNGHRLSFPRENLQPVAQATTEQAANVIIDGLGYGIWWPQVDAGLTLDGLLEGRTGNAKWMHRLRGQDSIAA